MPQIPARLPVLYGYLFAESGLSSDTGADAAGFFLGAAGLFITCSSCSAAVVSGWHSSLDSFGLDFAALGFAFGFFVGGSEGSPPSFLGAAWLELDCWSGFLLLWFFAGGAGNAFGTGAGGSSSLVYPHFPVPSSRRFGGLGKIDS